MWAKRQLLRGGGLSPQQNLPFLDPLRASHPGGGPKGLAPSWPSQGWCGGISPTVRVTRAHSSSLSCGTFSPRRFSG